MNYAIIIFLVCLWHLNIGEIRSDESLQPHQPPNSTNGNAGTTGVEQSSVAVNAGQSHSDLNQINNSTNSKDLNGHEQDTESVHNIPKGSNVIEVRRNNIDTIESGALLRGFYVFVGLSSLTLLYLVLRSYRLRNGGRQSNIVQKYGVRAKRSDMEMRHLEIEDEDDETLFDVNNKHING